MGKTSAKQVRKGDVVYCDYTLRSKGKVSKGKSKRSCSVICSSFWEEIQIWAQRGRKVLVSDEWRWWHHSPGEEIYCWDRHFTYMISIKCTFSYIHSVSCPQRGALQSASNILRSPGNICADKQHLFSWKITTPPTPPTHSFLVFFMHILTLHRSTNETTIKAHKKIKLVAEISSL